MHAVLSDCRGYLVVLSGRRELANLRTVLIGRAQDRTSLLTREVLITKGLSAENPIGGLYAFDVRGELALQSAGEKTGIPVHACDLAALAGVESAQISDCPNTVDFALAYGAALGLSDKVNTVNLRNDHMPFLGKKMRLQKAVRFLSISLTILLLSLGVLFHSQLLRVNQHREALRGKLEPDYLAVLPGKTQLPDKMKTAVYDLGRALQILNAEKNGIGADQESISAKMKLVLEALNKCAKDTNLSVESLTITAANITLNGTTSGRVKTNEVFDAMAKQGFELGNQSVGEDGQFSVTVEIKKQAQRT